MRLLANFLLIAACQFQQVPAQANPAPTEVSDFGQYDRFPDEVLGLRRGKIVEYEAPLRNYSIGYSRFDETLSNAVTLYFYPANQDKVAQVQAEIAAILRSHPNGQLSAQWTTQLNQGASSYEAHMATFEFEEVFAGKRQRLWSKLIVVFIADRTFKVRSTAPIEQGAFAAGKLMSFLERVQWAP